MNFFVAEFLDGILKSHHLRMISVYMSSLSMVQHFFPLNDCILFLVVSLLQSLDGLAEEFDN